MNKKYPHEIYEFITENVDGITDENLAIMTNEKFGTNFDKYRMHNFICNYHIKRKVRADMKKDSTDMWPKEIRSYIADHVDGTLMKDLTDDVNKEFGRSYSYGQVRAFCKRMKLTNGCNTRFKPGVMNGIPRPKGTHFCPETEWKKGHVPHNKKPVGTVLFLDRYLRIKTGEPNKWEFLHRHVWEQENGPIPEGMAVIFLDKNPMNCSIENLALVSRDENPALRRFHTADPEIRKVAINVVRLEQLIKRRNKEEENGKSTEQNETKVQTYDGPLLKE